MIREGQRVAYVGDLGVDTPVIGDEGKVLSASGNACHVRWACGPLTGQVTFHPAEDLVVASSRVTSDLDDSFEAPLVSFAVRDAYDRGGEMAVLEALYDQGHLAGLSQIAEEAAAAVARRLRTDPSFRAVLGHLEPDEGDVLVSLAAQVLLRDAFGGEG